MTVQRDRLVEALDAAYGVEGAGQRPIEALADALLARGVRVVDVDTLARAMTEAAPDGPGIRAEAAAILAALDRQP